MSSPLDPNTVNPSVPAWQAPTANVRTGNIEPHPTLPAAAAGLDPRTGNMARSQHGADSGPTQSATFPNPPSLITDRGTLPPLP
jgi:hypothetical protein